MRAIYKVCERKIEILINKTKKKPLFKYLKLMKIKYNGKILAGDVKVCASFFSAFSGLMFSKKLKPDQAILIGRNDESIINTAIHMIFVFQKLKILWLGSNKKIVDIKIAYPFISFLAPKKPAMYIVELNPENRELEGINEGDKLELVH